MTVQATQLLQEALALSDEDRSALVEELLISLHQPDPELDALWAREAEDRLAAYQAGEMEAIPAEQVFEELRRR